MVHDFEDNNGSKITCFAKGKNNLIKDPASKMLWSLG